MNKVADSQALRDSHSADMREADSSALRDTDSETMRQVDSEALRNSESIDKTRVNTNVGSPDKGTGNASSEIKAVEQCIITGDSPSPSIPKTAITMVTVDHTQTIADHKVGLKTTNDADSLRDSDSEALRGSDSWALRDSSSSDLRDADSDSLRRYVSSGSPSQTV